jgi:hypothetical protein
MCSCANHPIYGIEIAAGCQLHGSKCEHGETIDAWCSKCDAVDENWCYTCDRPKDDCACVENGGTY